MSDRKYDLIEVLIPLDPPLTMNDATRIAEAIRDKLRGYNPIISDIRGPEEGDDGD